VVEFVHYAEKYRANEAQCQSILTFYHFNPLCTQLFALACRTS